MPIQVLVMPGGEFGGQDQRKAVNIIKQFAEAGATGWAVQGVMRDDKTSAYFLHNRPSLIPGWSFGWRPIDLIKWFVQRRVEQIRTAIGVAGFVPELFVTDYERLDEEPADAYDAAVVKVSRAVGTSGLYGSGLDRFGADRLERLQYALGSRRVFPSAYFKLNYARGLEPRPIDATVRWAEEHGQVVVPYMSGAIAGPGGGGLVPLPNLRDELKLMIDRGVTTIVNWVDMTDPNAVRDVRHLLDAAGGVS